MNDYMYTNIRNYLEEIASTQREILKALQGQKAAPQARQSADTSKSKAASKPTGNVTTEIVKAEPLKTTETVEVKEPVQMAVQPPSFASKPGQTVTPSFTPTTPTSGAKG